MLEKESTPKTNELCKRKIRHSRGQDFSLARAGYYPANKQRLQMAKQLKSRIFSCKSPKPKLRNFQVSTNDFLVKMVNTGQE